MIYLMYLSGIFILRISISLRPSWKHSHSLKLDSSTLKKSLDLNNYTFSCTLARKTIRVEDSLVQVVSLSRANFRIDNAHTECTCRMYIDVFSWLQLLESSMSSTCPMPWFCEPTDIRKTRTRHSSRPQLGSCVIMRWWDTLCTPKDDGKFIAISSPRIHIAPDKEAVIYRRNDLKESPFVRWKTHQSLGKGYAEFGTKDQRMKMRPVSVNALVLELLMGTSNGYFELVVF